MDIKLKLGKKIRGLREEKKISREEFCQDESQLTVRQLGRIEKGESLPTLPKLSYIANQLSIPMNQLIDDSYMVLPPTYLTLKKRIYRSTLYANEARIKKQEQLFDELYENYYEKLPEEEQVIIDIFRTITDVHISSEAAYGMGILDEYLTQVLLKSVYNENDLLVIMLYFNCLEDYNESMITKISDKLLEQIDYEQTLDLYLLNQNIIAVLDLSVQHANYERIPLLIKAAKTIMESSNDYYRKPVVDMINGKYSLFYEEDVSLAKDKYEDAAKLAQLLGDTYLGDKILLEWEADYHKYTLKKKKEA